MSDFRQHMKSRFAVIAVLVIAVLSALLVRLWVLQVLNGEAYAQRADNNRVREISLAAPRGSIYDRNGVPLVINRSSLSITVDPSAEEVAPLLARQRNDDDSDDPTTRELAELFGELAAMVGRTPEEIFSDVADVRLEALRPRVVASDITMEVAAQLLERQTDFPWARVEEIAVREYPQGTLAAHVLGYTGTISESQYENQDEYAGYEIGDVVGKSGIELQYESVLQGDKGWRRIEVNASGVPQRVVSEEAARAGNDITLTLDIEVQRVAEQQLQAALAEAHSQGYRDAVAGAAVAVDIETGEVLAMASAPTYDPAEFLGGISTQAWEALTDEASEYPLNNRAVMAAYPPASTFKVITGLAGLESGAVAANQTFVCNGRWTEMGKQWPKWCWDHSGHGTEGLVSGMAQSCDVVFYEIGYLLYQRNQEELQAEARAFGLGSKTGVDLPGEVSGRVPDAQWKAEYNRNYPEYQRWLPGDTVNMAIGQGDMLATPLQMALVYAGIANDGVVMTPYLLQSVLDSEGAPVRSTEATMLAETGVSSSALDVIRAGLIAATESGTAKGAFRGFGVTVAGKTGTAEVKGKDDYAWFCGYAPADEPRYAVAVIVEQGGHGGSIAAPAGRNILAALLDQELATVHTTDVSR